MVPKSPFCGIRNLGKRRVTNHQRLRDDGSPTDSVLNGGQVATAPTRRPLYTPAQRQRRDASPWTLVQGILAPVQFLIFLVSLVLVARYLMTGEGFAAATISVIVKTFALYTIMVTGAIWEKEVFGQYLFAEGFYWEDMVSMVVIALHTAYLWEVLTGWGTPRQQMLLALAAYATYVVNAAQFIWKLRIARLQSDLALNSAANMSASVAGNGVAA
jgi:3-vinyl bacteriochlorophyllide hydratase